MLLVLQIAAGIVLGFVSLFVVLAYWRRLLKVVVFVLALAAVAGWLWWSADTLTPDERGQGLIFLLALIGLGYAAYRLPGWVRAYKLQRRAAQEEDRRRVLAILIERGREGATVEDIYHGLMTGPGSYFVWGTLDVSSALRALEKKNLVEHADAVWRAVRVEPKPGKAKIERVPSEVRAMTGA